MRLEVERGALGNGFVSARFGLVEHCDVRGYFFCWCASMIGLAIRKQSTPTGMPQ